MSIIQTFPIPFLHMGRQPQAQAASPKLTPVPLSCCRSASGEGIVHKKLQFVLPEKAPLACKRQDLPFDRNQEAEAAVTTNLET